MSSYILLAFSGDGQLSGLETLSDVDLDDGAAGRTASTLLAHDEPGARVEVWRDAQLVTVVGAATGHDWGV